jgi:hypothetical protein
MDEVFLHCLPAFGGANLRRIYQILDRAIGMGCPLTLAVSGPVTVSGQQHTWLIPLLETGWVAYLSTTANLTTYHPGTPTGGKRSWAGTGDTSWTQLGVHVSAPVQFGYACVAGTAGNALPALGITGTVNYPASPTTPWYVVKAVGDRDDDSVFAVLIGSSFTDEIYSEKEDE